MNVTDVYFLEKYTHIPTSIMKQNTCCVGGVLWCGAVWGEWGGVGWGGVGWGGAGWGGVGWGWVWWSGVGGLGVYFV